MRRLRGLIVGMMACAATCAHAAPDGGKAEAERDIQAYLAMWSSDGHFDAASVARFYAPTAVYYGKTFSRAQILADKRVYVRAWPIRHYAEVPGSFVGRCDAGRTLCKVSVVMRWRRVSARRAVSTGLARLSFDFVPVEGGHKIVREAASILDQRG